MAGQNPAENFARCAVTGGECGYQNVGVDDNLIHVRMIALVLSFGSGKQRIVELAPRRGSGSTAIAATTNHRGKTAPTQLNQ